MDIRKIISLLKKWFWLPILGALIAGSFGYYQSSRETPMFQASTRFVILRAATTGYDYYAYIDYQQLMSTYTQLLSTDALLAQVSEEVGFPVHAGQARAEQIAETQFVRLTVTHEDPVKAASIANALVNVLIEQNQQLQSVRYATTEENLQERIEQAQQQMELIQNQINDISTATIQSSLEEVISQIDELQNKINDLENKIAEIDPLYATDEEKALLVEYQDSLEQLQPILALYQEIYTNLVVLGQPAESPINESTQMSQLQFTLDLYQDIYISSLASLESLRLSRAQSTPNVVLTEPATIPNKPISPKPLRTAALGSAAGLLITAIIAFAIEYLDDTIKTPEEIENLVGLPVIGFLTDFKSNGFSKNNLNGSHSLFISTQPRSPVSEAVRSLKTNLEFSAVDQPLSTILVTSANPSEGKSTIAVNYALAVSQSGKKTLLLDADMRRPSIHKFFDIPNRMGLSEVLRSNLNLEQVTRGFESSYDFSVITSGYLPPDPSKLLASKKMSHTIEELKTIYDVIVIDCAPLVVSDPHVLAAIVDGLIYIVQPEKTRSQHLVANMQQLKQINANVLGVVFNKIQRSHKSYYGGYYYSYYPPKENTDYYN
ncbi:MAG: polysaccharide biosynthesis tyrosine autokinase [Chloroflexota bacterium]|nr:polysaccharide biosynthesis tyrosine autokinase [Chloroflexota bacterium]